MAELARRTLPTAVSDGSKYISYDETVESESVVRSGVCGLEGGEGVGVLISSDSVRG